MTTKREAALERVALAAARFRRSGSGLSSDFMSNEWKALSDELDALEAFDAAPDEVEAVSGKDARIEAAVEESRAAVNAYRRWDHADIAFGLMYLGDCIRAIAASVKERR